MVEVIVQQNDAEVEVEDGNEEQQHDSEHHTKLADLL